MENRCKYIKATSKNGIDYMFCGIRKGKDGEELPCPFSRYCATKKNTIMSPEYCKKGCLIEKKEKERLKMEKSKSQECQHDFIYDVSRLLMIFPMRVKGVCSKCGKQVSLTKQEYEKIIKKGK